MTTLDDFKKVEQLTALYRALDYYYEMIEDVTKDIRALAVNMSPKDIKYAIKQSEK